MLIGNTQLQFKRDECVYDIGKEQIPSSYETKPECISWQAETDAHSDYKYGKSMISKSGIL